MKRLLTHSLLGVTSALGFYPSIGHCAEGSKPSKALASEVIGTVKSAQAKDGHTIVFFATNVDGHLYLRHQTSSAGPEFSPPELLNQDVTRVEVVPDAQGVLHVVYRLRKDGNLFTRHQVGPNLAKWSEPVKIAEDVPNTSPIAIGFRPDGRLQVFLNATKDSGLVTRYQLEPGGKEWSEPIRISDSVSHLNLIRNADGRMQLFFRSLADRNLFTSVQSDPNSQTWSVPEKLQDGGTGWIGVSDLSDGRLQIFYLDPTGGHLYTRRQKEPSSKIWTAPEKIIENAGGRFAVVKGENGQLRVYAINGLDRNLYLRIQKESGQTEWTGPKEPIHQKVRDFSSLVTPEGKIKLLIREIENDALILSETN